MPFSTQFWDNLVIKSYKIILKRKKESSLIHKNLGLAYVRIGKDKKAIRSFQRSIKYDKKCAESYYHLGMTYRRLGKIEDALRCFTNYSKLLKINEKKKTYIDEVVEDLRLPDK